MFVFLRSEEVAPTSYISFQQAGSTSPTYTNIVANSVNPVWDYEAEVSLSTELLTEDGKVWCHCVMLLDLIRE